MPAKPSCDAIGRSHTGASTSPIRPESSEPLPERPTARCVQFRRAPIGGRVNPEEALTIDRVTLDSLATAYRPPEIVRIDVEGAEESVLAGAFETLRRHRTTLLVALHLGVERQGTL